MVRTAERRCADERRCTGEQRLVDAAVENDLEMRSFLRREGCLECIAGLRYQSDCHGSGGHGEQRGHGDYAGLQAPPTQVFDGLDEYSSHYEASWHCEGVMWTSSTMFPSVTVSI